MSLESSHPAMGNSVVATDAQALNAGELAGLPYFPPETTRLRSLGASSGHWAGWCRPLDALDMALRLGDHLAARYGR